MPDPATDSTLAGQGDGPAPPKGEAGAEARALIERQLAVLGRLAEAGLNIALAVERQVTAAEAAAPGAGSPAAVETVQSLALAYGRVSRAVRLTIALQSRLLKELQEIDAVAARKRYGAQAEAERVLRYGKEMRKERVQRLVGRVIDAEVSEAAEADRLFEEACERLEHDDIYGDLSARPVSEIIDRVCRDLGLAPDWARWAQEAWAQEEIDGGAEGSPLMSLRWLDPPQTVPADPGPMAPQAASP